MTYGDVREGKWRGNWRKEWVANTLHTTSEHGVSSITTVHAHASAASSRLTPTCRFKWTRPFRRKTKSGFCACAITFQTQSTETVSLHNNLKGSHLGTQNSNSSFRLYMQHSTLYKLRTSSVRIRHQDGGVCRPWRQVPSDSRTTIRYTFCVTPPYLTPPVTLNFWRRNYFFLILAHPV